MRNSIFFFGLFSSSITFLLKIKFHKNGTNNGNWLFLKKKTSYENRQVYPLVRDENISNVSTRHVLQISTILKCLNFYIWSIILILYFVLYFVQMENFHLVRIKILRHVPTQVSIILVLHSLVHVDILCYSNNISWRLGKPSGTRNRNRYVWTQIILNWARYIPA